MSNVQRQNDVCPNIMWANIVVVYTTDSVWQCVAVISFMKYLSTSVFIMNIVQMYTKDNQPRIWWVAIICSSTFNNHVDHTAAPTTIYRYHIAIALHAFRNEGAASFVNAVIVAPPQRYCLIQNATKRDTFRKKKKNKNITCNSMHTQYYTAMAEVV